MLKDQWENIYIQLHFIIEEPLFSFKWENVNCEEKFNF
jgi:hypothetical protein